ncbi:MAG TPA: histidine kinase [Naasia sp.]
MTDSPTSLDRHSVPVEGDLLLPKPPGMLRQFWYRHPRWSDAALAFVYVLLAFGGVVLAANAPGSEGSGGAPPAAPAAAAAVLLGAAALFLRRSRPWLVLAVSWAVTVAVALVTGTPESLLTALALYALAVYGSVRAAWIGLAASVVVGTAAELAGRGLGRAAGEDVASVVGNMIATAVLLLVVVLVGINVGNRRRYLVALLDRAAQLARERDQQAQLAAVTERSRIARDMHDIVSHSLTVMVTLAEGSAAAAGSNPERAADAMRQVAETGRQALGDMRRMLGVLEDGSSSSSGATGLAPQPGIAELEGLVASFRSAGLAVEFASQGVPPADSAEQLTVYRLVQESLTNVLRHSPGAAGVRVAVRYDEDEVAITVTNEGSPLGAGTAAEPAPANPGGHGIVGMRERVALYGGTVESGPRPGGGWMVTAVLRHDATPQQPPSAGWTPVQ